MVSTKNPVKSATLFCTSWLVVMSPFVIGSLNAQDGDAEENVESTAGATAEATVDSGWPASWATSLASIDGGSSLVVGTADGLLLRESAVVLSDPANLSSAKVLYTHPASVWKVVGSENNICSADYRGNLVVMNRASGESKLHDAALERWCRALAFAPDAKSIIAGNESGKLFVWSLEKGESIQTAQIDEDQIYEIAFSPAGDQIAVADGGGHLHLLSWPELSEQRKIELGTQPIWAAKYTSDGTRVFAGGADRKLWRIDIAADSVPVVVGETGDWITAITCSPTGESVVAATMDGTLISVPASGDAIPAQLEVFAKLPSGVWDVTMPTANQLLTATRKHAIGKLGQAWQIEVANEPELVSVGSKP
jgi:WD40 repeat protein